MAKPPANDVPGKVNECASASETGRRRPACARALVSQGGQTRPTCPEVTARHLAPLLWEMPLYTDPASAPESCDSQAGVSMLPGRSYPWAALETERAPRVWVDPLALAPLGVLLEV